jgi:hypothetical protein
MPAVDVSAAKLLADSKRPKELVFPTPHEKVDVHCREAQNAIRAAIASSTDAIAAGSILNRLSKLSEGKELRGNWTAQAQDSLRAAVLFAGAGIDRALKSLVETSIERLIASDTTVQKKFEGFAAEDITDKDTRSVDPQMFVNLLLAGGNPADVLRSRWIRKLTESSAQSAERVEELCTALGVTEDSIRRRTKPSAKGRSTLQQAFDARNQIAHELDVTKPLTDTRQPLEDIRERRAVTKTETLVQEVLSLGQDIVNDVAQRLDASS